MQPSNPQQAQLFTVAVTQSGSVEGRVTMATVPKPLLRPVRRREASRKSSDYAPLPSVWYGEDAELLEGLLDFYPRRKPRRILDATVNGGRFWRGSKRPVIGLDIERSHKPNLVGDNTAMPFR